MLLTLLLKLVGLAWFDFCIGTDDVLGDLLRFFNHSEWMVVRSLLESYSLLHVNLCSFNLLLSQLSLAAIN